MISDVTLKHRIKSITSQKRKYFNKTEGKSELGDNYNLGLNSCHVEVNGRIPNDFYGKKNNFLAQKLNRIVVIR